MRVTQTSGKKRKLEPTTEKLAESTHRMMVCPSVENG
jgi:hypothetical protein